MCHRCKKAQALESLSNQALKPVSLALARLHRKVEPNLGGFWKWRYDTPLRLQIVLGGLQNLVQISTLAEVIKEVEDELLHCEKQMADHPALEQGLIASSAGDTYSDKKEKGSRKSCC